MKTKLLLLLLLIGSTSLTFAQSSQRFMGQLNATCASASAACATAGAQLMVSSQGYNLLTVTVNGTYAGSTINFEWSDDGGTFWYADFCTRSDLQLQVLNEVLPSNQTRAYNCNVVATNFRVRQSAFGSGAVNVAITLFPGATPVAQTVANNVVDPCQSSSIAKSSAVINIASATTTALVALSGTTTVYVCGWSFTAAVGTAATYQFEYGTGATCGTGTTVLTGAMIGNAGPLTMPVGATIIRTPAGNAVCMLTAGTGPSAQGVLTFVQQ